MTDITTQLEDILDNKLQPAVAVETLTAIIGQYPYFTAPAEILLDRYSDRLTDSQRMLAMTTVATAAADPTTLYSLTDRRAPEFNRFYPPQPEKEEISTDDAISTFLKNYGNDSPEETSLLEKLIFNPVPDYASVLTAQSDSDESVEIDDTTLRINSFIESHGNTPAAETDHEPATTEEKLPQQSKPQPDSLLSESLAKIYIKQRRYDKAHEIITQLSLNYPEKSCYFADQLRFLKKLIINQTHKK